MFEEQIKTGFVTIIGRPNAGKSTLLNNILKQKIAIMSDKPQTTRNIINGVYTDNDSQIVFIDTPGIHKPKHRLGDYMMKLASSAIQESEIVYLIINASEKFGVIGMRTQGHECEPKRHDQKPADGISLPAAIQFPFEFQPQRHNDQPKRQNGVPDDIRQRPTACIGDDAEHQRRGEIMIGFQFFQSTHAGVFPQRNQGNQPAKCRPQPLRRVKQHTEHQRQHPQRRDNPLFQHF